MDKIKELEKEIEYLKKIIELQRELIKANQQPIPQYPNYPWQPYINTPYEPIKIWYSNGIGSLNQMSEWMQ